MCSSIVIGALQFTGFHLTERLLDRGEKVFGIDHFQGDGDDYIHEHKQDAFGRNANFISSAFHEELPSSFPGASAIYVCLYDFWKMPERDTEKIADAIAKILINLKNVQPLPTLTILIPLGQKEQSFAEHTELWSILKSFAHARFVYLPAIYGPWQPASFAFETGIQKKSKEEAIDAISSEYRNDAIYISDFIDALEKLKEHDGGNIVFESEAKQQWQACANLIFDTEILDRFPSEGECLQTANVLKVKNNVSPYEGINKQKEHWRKMLMLKQHQGRNS
ncbi:Nucleoside-diphosphate-sugar epimerase [Bacillus sp. OV322]|uniref:NAD(P)-dependent oxidoreductase n=1 Tax=Bacillus sp. OV322 TaxID=1882764 RepID=UPI0008ECF1D0|nr:NAD(P)-dependent oxidoreductase [Bacillus sp. OV322]SFB97482.1 Nucleoside-diphosphate-sugar epimerase [Bacillus sp. OV322]